MQFGIRLEATFAGEMLEQRPSRRISSGTTARSFPGGLLGPVLGD
jgi:hypothetical protein